MYIYIAILLLSVLLIYLYFNNPFKTHQDICNDIYRQKPLYTTHKVIRQFLTKEQCNEIIYEGEHYGYIHGWTTQRHDDYPTTDNLIENNWNCHSFLKQKIESELYPQFEKLYQLTPNKLKIEEIFIAKYDGDTKQAQKDLEYHEDGSEFSFIVALNDDYVGGGTHFSKENKTIHLKTGDVVIFCGQTRHGGIPVTKGTRYILPGFLYYGKCKQQDE